MRTILEGTEQMWVWFLVVILVLVPALGYLYERAQRKQRNIFSSWPIPPARLPDLDPAFAQTELGPTLDTEVAFIGGSSVVAIPGGTSDTEAWILSVLAKRARMMFEFGTCTGRTAYLWARNSPPDARIVTLTLGSDDVAAYRRDGSDTSSATRIALAESKFDSFYYSDTPVAAKVRQLFGDSKAFDESPWAGQCDLVFVDGSHARSYVVSDSRKALRLVKPGGLVLWHDYRGYKLRGVFDTLNELARELPLVHIRGTTLVAYRCPG
jgi:predicted O-methyltransferase YrrM